MMRSSRMHHDPESIQRSLQRLPKPVADPAFRSALRAAFVSRSIPERRATAVVRLPGARSFLRAGAVAVAATLIAAVILNSGPAWQLRGISGTNSLRLDGRMLAIGSPEIGHLLRAGVRIELPPGAQLDLELPGIAAFQVVGGSEMVLPASPGRWFARAVRGWLETGEVRITTGPRFRGAGLMIETPEVRAVVTGTTFAVFRLADGSCVCVLEGAVAMNGPTSAPDTVRAGFRRQVFRDGRPPLLEPIRPIETMKLEMLRGQAGAVPRR